MIAAYLARGWRPVPLHHVLEGRVCSCRRGPECTSQGKHPIYENWQKLLLTEHTLRKVLDARPHMNVGIATGRPSAFWALDVDDQDAAAALQQEWGSLPTPFQVTGSGGLHYLFEMPADFEPTNSAGRLPPGIDVRGTGGQIVAPPSISAKGVYRATAWARIVHPNIPWLLDLVRPLPYTERSPAGPITPDNAPEYVRATAYAARIVHLECAELAGEGSTRNARAFRAACRMHELINAGWTSYDHAEGQYLTACQQASGNKREPFPESEARDVWAHAAMRVGDKQADLPPSSLGGERLDFPQAPMAPSTSPTGTAAAGSLSLEQMLSSGLSLAIPRNSAGPTRSGATPELNLPASFWEERPVLKHIRDAAHAQIVSADVAFYTVLARLAAMWPHRAPIISGVKGQAAANLFVAICGPSGIGKTSGISVARKLLDPPSWLDGQHRDAFADDLPLGSGEGIAEAFMGTAKRQATGMEGEPLVMRDGQTPKLESVRTQVRHNALLHADEGEIIARMLERSGATIGETIRRAWVGATIGQSNGRSETTRIIREGHYSLGLVVGFQEETAQPLLADEAAGTPQRFLWCWVIDPSMTDDETPSPGPLTDVWPPPPLPPQVPGTPWLVDPAGANSADTRPVTFAPEIRTELRTELLARQRGELALQRQDAHRPLMLVKVSALLAQLDGGRRYVTEDDWRLARIVWDTSCRVRDHLIAYGLALSGKAAAARREAFAGDHAAAETARLSLHDDRDRQALERVAKTLAIYAQRRGGEQRALTRRELRDATASRDRSAFPAAVEAALERSWIVAEGTSFRAGPVRLV
jgi:energy-coupling factor transporter ATP-binding protein EcfA2